MKQGLQWLPVVICCCFFISATSDKSSSNSGNVVNALQKDAELIFLPSYALRNDAGADWQIWIHAWVFEPESDSVKRKLFIDVAKKDIGLGRDDVRSKQFETMMRFLLVDQEQSQKIGVVIGGKQFYLGKTDRIGHVESTITVPDSDVKKTIINTGGARYITFYARTTTKPQRFINGRARILEKSGVMVVSDIDDTVKITGVGNQKQMIENSLCRPFRAVSGMAGLYRALAQHGAVFQYVSASPWQMYPHLSEFLSRAGFPDGLFQLRYVGLKSVSGLFASSESVKKPYILRLMKEFPAYQFILIGDSGEKDPELYGECARNYPAQVIGIVIRNITDESREDERMAKAFSGIQPGLWHLVKKPGDLPWSYRTGRIVLKPNG